MRSWSVCWCLVLPSIPIVQSCLDADDRCGPEQTYQDGSCVCVANAVPAEDHAGCTLCGEHQVASAGRCVCDVGYAMDTVVAQCVPSAIGQPCDDNEQTCRDPAYPFCAADTLGGRYCTSLNCSDEIGRAHV
jgi:hypothetical protein